MCLPYPNIRVSSTKHRAATSSRGKKETNMYNISSFLLPPQKLSIQVQYSTAYSNSKFQHSRPAKASTPQIRYDLNPSHTSRASPLYQSPDSIIQAVALHCTTLRTPLTRDNRPTCTRRLQQEGRRSALKISASIALAFARVGFNFRGPALLVIHQKEIISSCDKGSRKHDPVLPPGRDSRPRRIWVSGLLDRAAYLLADLDFRLELSSWR
ncbi:hypothetical protein L207DRAFT_292281 [Hyaloscypha variabilis F]|uniref:Uncharacterized protein n=1 Tax=Hyaloscypha variabilis (strain UAMH 11265 / GT02V1 / F) TaxID=1149755 RepID=A0A2J6RXL5_HYAVF|nr:hypothetical protein L207DRAFT_292281 [Hyaloscypha variabilis F]